MIKKLGIEDIDVSAKRVFLRLDLNVPLSDNGTILDDSRIDAALPTIKKLLSRKAKLIISSHLGRPKGKRDDRYSLKPVAFALEEKLNQPIRFCPVINGEIAKAAIELMKPSEILLMENIRFYPEEEANDLNFCKEIASNIDIYINDAFGTLHRAHASTYGLAQVVPIAVCGDLIRKEIEYLDHHLNNPKRPFIALIGGAKVRDKITILKSLLTKVDELIIGGGMAYTFLKCLGYSIGASLFEEESVSEVEAILNLAKQNNKKIILPIDHLAASEFKKEAKAHYFEKNIDENFIGMDIGEKTLQLIEERIAKAKTIFWNGPMGVFEFEHFKNGTYQIANFVAQSEAVSIVGGGDSVSAIEQSGQRAHFTHISTGGGAALSLIEGAELPGLVALKDKTEI